MKAVKSESLNLNEIVNWRDFTLGYISAARASADAYLNHNPKIGGFASYGKFAFIPAFWNFKHAIELGIKFLFPDSDKPWGHDLVNNLKKYQKEKNLTNEECRELKVMCKKYGNLKPLQKLKDIRGNAFMLLSDYGNQFFHYPDGKDASHRIVYDANNHFAYYSLTTSQPDNNEKVMYALMKELKADAFAFAKILGDHTS